MIYNTKKKANKLPIQNPYTRRNLPASNRAGSPAEHAVPKSAGKASTQPCSWEESLPWYWWPCSVWHNYFTTERTCPPGTMFLFLCLDSRNRGRHERGEGNGRIMGGNGTAGPGGSGEDGNGNSGGGIGTSQSDTDSGDAEGTGTDRTDTDKNRTDADQANSNSTDANSTDINNTDTNNTDTNNVDTNNADTNNTGINNIGSNSTDYNSVDPNSTDPNSTNPNSANPNNGNSKAKAELTGPGRNQNLPPFTGLSQALRRELLFQMALRKSRRRTLRPLSRWEDPAMNMDQLWRQVHQPPHHRQKALIPQENCPQSQGLWMRQNP